MTMGVQAAARDFADVGADMGDAVIAGAISGAKPITGSDSGTLEPPRPLRRPLGDPAPYPLKALGHLATTVQATNKIIEAPVEICAQSALAHTALAVQGHANVILPTGQDVPVSLFLLSVAQSGDRKSAADRELGWALDRHERNLSAAHAIDRASFKNDLEAWTAARAQAKQIEKDKDRRRIASALDSVGTEPLPPRDPVISYPEPTIEGLHKQLAVGQSSMGLLSDEGGQFVGGVGMSKENSLKTAAGFSKLWDGSPVKRLRAGDGSTVLFGRRVTLHLMIQTDAAMTWLSDPVLRDQGLFSRVLIAAPRSLAGTRFLRDAPVGSRDEIKRFGARLLNIYEHPLPFVEGTDSELDPRKITMSDAATAMWWAFRDSVEKQLGEGGLYRPVTGLAGKICEHAARLATVLALFENIAVTELSVEALANGITLAQWYLGEALRLTEAGAVSEGVKLAELLLRWLLDVWPGLSDDGKLISPPDVYQYGPGSIREKATALRALEVLQDHGWLIPIEGTAKIRGVNRRDAFTVRSV